MLEKPRLNFGPPQSYEEAFLRLPNYMDLSRAMGEFKQLLHSPFLDELSPKFRIIGVSIGSIMEMERWSFRRDLTSVRKTGWDHFLPHYRVKQFSDVFKADERHRELQAWKLNPVSDNPDFTLVCVKAKPGFISKQPEYFLGFLKHEEYDLLFPQE